MSELREFPTAVVASLSSGVALCRFDAIHAAAEHLMGHPIWTHHFASEELWWAMREKVLEQHPNMPTDFPGISPENYLDKVSALEKEFGPICVIRKGDGKTVKHPLEGIPDGKPVIIVTV